MKCRIFVPLEICLVEKYNQNIEIANRLIRLAYRVHDFETDALGGGLSTPSHQGKA